KPVAVGELVSPPDAGEPIHHSPPTRLVAGYRCAASLGGRKMIGTIDIDTIRTDYPVSSVVGAMTKLHRAGREWKACCPSGAPVGNRNAFKTGMHTAAHRKMMSHFRD